MESHLVTSLGFLVFGFVLLLKGADWLVEGSCSIAQRAGISQLLVGLTIVSFGTSLPEFFINIVSRLSGETDIAVGNIIGANIANIFLVLGLSAAIHPLTFKLTTMKYEIPFGLLVIAVFALLWNDQDTGTNSFHGLTRPDGIILLTFFAAFIFYILRMQKTRLMSEIEPLTGPYSARRSIGMVLVGIPSLAIGANWVVESAANIASRLGVSESVIGLTVIAFGTTLAEMATSVVASFKKRGDIAVGNVVGSNIFNICWILGVSASLSPLAVPKSYSFDIGVMIAAPLLLLIVLWLGRRGRLSRLNGIFFVFCYLVYLGTLMRRSSAS